MRKPIGLSLSLALALTALAAVPGAAQSDNSRNSIGDTEGPTHVVFLGPGEAHSFLVTIPEGADGDGRNGRLTVETQDYFGCVDYWGARIVKENGKVMADAVGDGTTDWSGAAMVKSLPKKHVTVQLYYDHGCDTFPANMFVRYTFTGEDIEVTPAP